jgi:rubrerythrin
MASRPGIKFCGQRRVGPTAKGHYMNSQQIFAAALEYEKKIRDLYRSAEKIVDDARGGAIFLALADDEQSHVDFLLYSLEQLKANEAIDIDRLVTSIPTLKQIEAGVAKMKTAIPRRMLGDIKSVLGSALKLEKETSAFYRDACGKTEGAIKTIFEKFLVIEDRHVDVVQIELDHAQHNGMWFNFMEVDLEAY